MENAPLIQRKFRYFKALTLSNIKCFRIAQRVEFSKNDKPCMWNMILGENGTGKSTILRCLASMILSETDELGVNYQTNLTKEVHDKGILSLSFIKKGLITLNVNNKGIFENQEHIDFDFEEFPIFAYGSYRNSGSTGLRTGIRSQCNTLFDENSFLINAEDWILQSDYRDVKSQDGSDQLKIVKDLLLEILDEEVTDITINEEKRSFVVKFKTRYGWVRFNELSSGYRSLISWMVDLINWLTTFYPDSKNHSLEPAIVLVDEIDLHLHVSLQRNLVNFLTSKFPNIQFIVTAHSPLVIQGSQDENIILLEKDNDHVIVSHNPINVQNWRVDQILTSDLFGLESARGLETEKKIKRREELLVKDSLTMQEQKEMKNLNQFMYGMPNYEDKELDEASQIIKEAAASLKKLKERS